MEVTLHPHAQERLVERGVSVEEVTAVIMSGEQFPAKFGRVGFRRNFNYDQQWRGKYYATKQVEVFVVQELSRWLVITVIARYF